MLAEEQVNYVSGIVSDKMVTVLDWATRARETAELVIAAIGKFPVPVIGMTLPDPPDLGDADTPSAGDPEDTPVSVAPKAVEYQETEQVQFTIPPELPILAYGAAVAPKPAPTNQVATPPTNYPQVAIPAVPDVPQLTKPSTPTISNAARPPLLHVVVPAFTFPILPGFEAPYPYYTPPAPIAPVAPVIVYPVDLPGDVRARILALLGGTTAELDDTREAMIDRLVETADIEAQKKIDELFDTAAARNFATPPGPLVDSVNDARYEAGQKIRDGMSEINNKLAAEALKNYQAGMELALVLEKAYISLYLEFGRQVLAAEKINAQIAVELFNATVALFNAQQSARQVHADAYRAQVQGIVTGMSAYPTAIDGAIAETAENEQNIQMYAADGRLVKARADVFSATTKSDLAPIEAYKAELGGIKAQADVIVANVDSYRAAVTAYAAGVSASTEPLNAYANETQAKTSQAHVYSANAKAFASYVQEGVKRANTWNVFAKSQGDVLRANVQTYQTAADTNQAFARAQAAQIGAEADIAQSRAGAYSTGQRAVTIYNKAVMDNSNAQDQYAMIAAENVARAQNLLAIAQAETDKINAGAMAAQTQALAGLAQGAMSALHVSAGAEGAGAMSAGATWEQGADQAWGGNVRHDETKAERVSA